MRFPWRESAWIAAVLILSAGVYLGAYYGFVDPSAMKSDGNWCRPRYLIADASAAPLFQPAHEIDRGIRAEFWNEKTRLFINSQLQGRGLKLLNYHDAMPKRE